MIFPNQTQTNITAGLQYQNLLEIVLFAIVTTLPCCVFFFINVTMLFTLRSKPVFRETSRYVLLYNLLFADTLQLAQGQIVYLLSASRTTLLYPVCGALITLNNLSNKVSPLTLVAMSLERYVAVCFPLKHTSIITIRNTVAAIVVVWAFSSLNVITQAVLMANIALKDLQHQQMKDFCGKENMFLDPISDLYDRGFTYCLFVFACVSIMFLYIGVMFTAKSASTNKASARKARNTLLLHLVQLALSLSSAIHNPLLYSISKELNRVVIVRIQIVIYISIIILPRCLSSLIYGLRDQNIRPVLMVNLCCQWRGSLLFLVPIKA